VNIKDIIIGKRHRINLGDIEVLKQSISELGLLQPIVIKKGTNELVAGFRRLHALKELGLGELTEGIHINFIDIESIIRGEHDENTCREEFTISEKVAIFEAMKDEQKRLGIAREIMNDKKPSGNDGPTKFEHSGTSFTGPHTIQPASFPKSNKTAYGSESARSYAARAVGLHYNTLRKATEIVSAARKEPGRYDHLVKEMDMSGKVEPIFQKYIEEKSRPAIDGNRLSPALSKLLSDRGASIPEFVIIAFSRISPGRQEDLLQHYADILRTVKRSDIERSLKSFSQGRTIETLSEKDIFEMLGSILEHAGAFAQEWVFLPQVRQVAALMMNVAKSRGSVSSLDKLDFFMIGLAGFVDMACSYLQVANKDGILRDIPADALEKYLAAIDAFQMLYESKLPRQIGALRIKENERVSGNIPDVPTIRDHVNAMKANEMITDAAEGSMPYYRNLLAGLIQNFREGAQKLKEAPVP